MSKKFYFFVFFVSKLIKNNIASLKKKFECNYKFVLNNVRHFLPFLLDFKINLFFLINLSSKNST